MDASIPSRSILLSGFHNQFLNLLPQELGIVRIAVKNQSCKQHSVNWFWRSAAFVNRCTP